MKRHITFALTLTFFVTTLFAQEVRTYDGSSNNLNNPTWGATHTQLARLAPADYADKIAAPAGAQRQNPRKLSNALFAQEGPLADRMGLSDFVWVFGQLIDHDITLSEGSDEPAMIPINFPDVHFNPGGAIPNVMIRMSRTAAMEGTGTDENNPREHFNEITAWLDASCVYGSDAFRANWLRTFEDGKLKVSEGNLLPFNTESGEFNNPVYVDAPNMADDVGRATRLFVAGDVRANENVLLTAYHTLFVREHNRLCEELILQHPDWQDEQIYQHARKIVGGILQRITFDEWLPAMGVNLATYRGYDSSADPSIFNGFSGAAFRLGHTLLSGDILVMDAEGNERAEGPLALRDAFFNPNALIDNGGLDPFFRGMGAQMQQQFDAKIVDDVRNFLFGPPGAGGTDLASININRGRERGLPDFNSYRSALGLTPYRSFREMNDNSAVIEALQSNYSSVDDIDPWVGMLAEKHMPDALFGETVRAFLHLQFSVLRDGDRFYYENDRSLSTEEKNNISATTMRDVVMRNTGIKLMQDNVFEAMPMQEICGFFGESAQLQGVVTNEFGATVLNVDIELTDGSNQVIASTIANGGFQVSDVSTCEDIIVRLDKKDNYSNGITTLDMVLILKHILNIEAFDSPYQFIAADVNKSNSISAADLVAIRKVILGTTKTFPNNNGSWRFIDADYNFLDDNPLDEAFPETLTINLSKDTDFNFVAVKVGDVNGTADHTSAIDADGLISGESRTSKSLAFTTEDMQVVAGETYTIPFKANSEEAIIGYQFTLNYSQDALAFEALNTSATLTADNIAMDNGVIRASWNSINAVDTETLNFAMTFTATKNGRLSELLSIQSNPTVAEAYDANLDILPVNLAFTQPVSKDLALYQNQPNPFKGNTTIGFDLPASSAVQLQIFDVAGKQLQLIEGDYSKGYNAIELNTTNLSTSGVLYYQLHTSFGSLTKKMMVVE
ncbi:MAG: peroxidase family protein [Saprospiraceae bacterium]